MPKKGISPLIATILLIAFVIAVGGILSGWLVSFSKERTQEAATKGETDIKCSYASLYVSDANCNSTKKTISLIAENTGNQDLSDFTLTVIYVNNSVSNIGLGPSSVILYPGDVENFYNGTETVICNNISKIIFKSDTCPVDARDSLDKNDIDIVS